MQNFKSLGLYGVRTTITIQIVTFSENLANRKNITNTNSINKENI